MEARADVLHRGAEEKRICDDDVGDVGAGEADAGEQGWRRQLESSSTAFMHRLKNHRIHQNANKQALVTGYFVSLFVDLFPEEIMFSIYASLRFT